MACRPAVWSLCLSRSHALLMRSRLPGTPPQCTFALIPCHSRICPRLPPGHYPLLSGKDPVSSDVLASPLHHSFGPRLAFSFPSSPGPRAGPYNRPPPGLSSLPSASPCHSSSLLPQAKMWTSLPHPVSFRPGSPLSLCGPYSPALCSLQCSHFLFSYPHGGL